MITADTRGAAIAALALACCASNAHADAGYSAAPWQLYRDTNPFVAASGLPFAPPAVAPQSWHVEAMLSASNTELAFDRGNEHLVYDAEIHEGRIALTRAIGEHWLLRATIADASLGKGFLDSFLEGYHRTFGFTNGDRGQLGMDSHKISYSDASGREVFLDRSLSAVTPLIVDVALRATADGHEFLYGATFKLPTTHASPLIDDRAVDLSFWLAAQSTNPQTRMPWGARVGVMQRGDTQLLPQQAKDQVPFADATLGYMLMPRWDVAAQLQWHGALYDSQIPLLSSAANLTLSSAWHASAGWTVRAGLVEDAIPRHAQDVTFFVDVAVGAISL